MRDTHKLTEIAQQTQHRRRTKAGENSKTGVISPLAFASQAVPRVWGGRALGELLGHSLPTEHSYGETWDISDLPEYASRVADGPHRGKTLSELWKLHRSELHSGLSEMETGFPLLIKWLDCRDWLSVQVHPDDAMARELLDQPWGKSEVWVILRAESTARVYAGFRHGVSREDFLRHLDTGSIDECLHSFIPKAGDCIVLPAGTIHAAGGGLLVAEIQQSSDATFRLFDWNRLGLDAKPRPLQIEMGLDAIDWNQGAILPTAPRPIQIERPGIHGEKIADLHAFTIERYKLNEAWTAPHEGELTIWMVLDGKAKLTAPKTADSRDLVRGQTVMIPAAAGEIHWSLYDPESPPTLICVRLPNSLG